MSGVPGPPYTHIFQLMGLALSLESWVDDRIEMYTNTALSLS